MKRYSSFEDRAECPTYGVSLMGTTFNGRGSRCEWRRREPLGGGGGGGEEGGEVGAYPPRKFSNMKALKPHFQYSQANSCVKKVPIIDCYFLNFDKNSVAISCNIFS